MATPKSLAFTSAAVGVRPQVSSSSPNPEYASEVGHVAPADLLSPATAPAMMSRIELSVMEFPNPLLARSNSAVMPTIVAAAGMANPKLVTKM